MKLHNIDAVRDVLARFMRNDLPEITAMALNDVAYDGLDAVKTEMQVKFDRPTRFTLNAFMVWRANAQTLTAIVQEKNSVGSRHYLKVQQSGGARPQTGFERALTQRLAYGGQIVAVTPAAGARLDASGNWSSGQRNQVMSDIKVQRDKAANSTAASRARKKRTAVYFVPKPGSGLSPGVYMRTANEVIKVLHFTRSQPNYTKRIDFDETVERKTRTTYEDHFNRRLTTAIQSMR